MSLAPKSPASLRRTAALAFAIWISTASAGLAERHGPAPNPAPAPSESPLPQPPPRPAMTAPPGRTIYTSDMVPVGTPVKLHSPGLIADGFRQDAPIPLIVAEDVVVGGRTVIARGNMAWAHYVSGSMTQTGYGGTVCSPTAGIAMNTEVRMTPKITIPRVPILPGAIMANQHQRVPISFAPPAGGSEVLEIPLRNCVAFNVDVVAYTTGPPTAP